MQSLKIALPIVVAVYLFLRLLMSVRFLKINKLFKTSLILFLIDLLYLIPPFVRVKNSSLQKGIDDVNIFKADFSRWIPELTVDNNIHLIVALSLCGLAILFLVGGLILQHARKKQKNNK